MTNKEKQVQIPLKTFTSLLLLTEDLLNNSEIDYNKIKQLNQDLHNKLDAMAKRNLYTKYKTAPTEEEKEKARNEYLDKIEINKNFIY